MKHIAHAKVHPSKLPTKLLRWDDTAHTRTRVALLHKDEKPIRLNQNQPHFYIEGALWDDQEALEVEEITQPSL
jgi:hypothetical protein